MEALEFARELKRMCEFDNGNCSKCDLHEIMGADLCDCTNLEKAIPIVEKWSAEHPPVRNVDWVAEQLEKIGYRVDKNKLMKGCPVPYSTYFDAGSNCPNKPCFECRKWWNEQYKESKE